MSSNSIHPDSRKGRDQNTQSIREITETIEFLGEFVLDYR
jgi:hypothetical protein